jgi:FkbM family methyltransferase
LARAEQRYDRYYRRTGGGLKKLLQRAVFSPGVYGAHLLWKYGLLEKVEVKGTTFWGRQMKLRLGDMMSTHPIYFFGFIAGTQESKLTRYFINNLHPDDVFYDIGSNWGFYTLLAQKFISAGEIHTFEPLPSLFEYLGKNATQAGCCPTQLNNMALWSQPGDISFFDGTSEGHSGASTAVEAVAAEFSTKKLSVRATSLDEYVKTHARPTIMKIDVEGGERHVISGGREFLASASPTVVMEIWSGELGQKFSIDAVRILCEFGYSPHFITADGELQQTEPDAMGQIEQTDNIVFKKLS